MTAAPKVWSLQKLRCGIVCRAEHVYYDVRPKPSGKKRVWAGMKKPNGLGIYDMSGNVWEWVKDRWDDRYYEHSERNNPQGSESGSCRVIRGGSWYEDPLGVQVTNRHGGRDYKARYIGFRLARTP